jgi:hypothetical protein
MRPQGGARGRGVLALEHVELLPRRLGRRSAALLLGLLLAVGLVLWAAVGRSSESPPPSVSKVSQTAMEEEVGVRVTQLAVTGNGGLIDLRYQVVDPDKAAIVHDPGYPPSIVDEETGARVSELWMNHLHRGPLHAGVVYYMLFVNRGGLIRPGSRVSVRLGSVRLEGVAVE